MLEYSQNHIRRLRIEEFPRGEITETWVHIINNGIGEPVRIPMLIARGLEEGPVLGLTAALHGNELNGIPVIQRLFKELNVHPTERHHCRYTSG
jgi:predicted deacylase